MNWLMQYALVALAILAAGWYALRQLRAFLRGRPTCSHCDDCGLSKPGVPSCSADPLIQIRTQARDPRRD